MRLAEKKYRRESKHRCRQCSTKNEPPKAEPALLLADCGTTAKAFTNLACCRDPIFELRAHILLKPRIRIVMSDVLWAFRNVVLAVRVLSCGFGSGS